MTIEDLRQQIAKDKYGVTYEYLSEWGKRTVTAMAARQIGSQELPVAPYQVNINTPSLDDLRARLSSLEIENAELWDDNEELRLENQRLRNLNYSEDL